MAENKKVDAGFILGVKYCCTYANFRRFILLQSMSVSTNMSQTYDFRKNVLCDCKFYKIFTSLTQFI